jgi:hypothetical protein
MPLQGRAKVRYQREYMRKQRAGLPTTAPKSRCMLCLKAASADRILIGNGAGYVCEACMARPPASSSPSAHSESAIFTPCEDNHVATLIGARKGATVIALRC